MAGMGLDSLRSNTSDSDSKLRSNMTLMNTFGNVNKADGFEGGVPNNANQSKFGAGAAGSLNSVSMSMPMSFGSPAMGFNKSSESSLATLSSSFSSPLPGFVRPGERLVIGTPSKVANVRGIPSQVNLQVNFGKQSNIPTPPQQNFPAAPIAKSVVSVEQYSKAWREEKDADLKKFRKLAWEVIALKSQRPNAIDKLHSAANRVPIKIEFNVVPVLGGRAGNSFKVYVFVEGIHAGTGQSLKKQDAKQNAYEIALQRVLMPELRIVQIDPKSRELQGSEKPFTTPPSEPSKSVILNCSSTSEKTKPAVKPVLEHKESNIEAASVKRRLDDQRPLEDFVIVEPLVPIRDCTPAHTIRRSADFNHMLLEYEYFFKGESARCVMKLEGQILADVNSFSKLSAKNRAAEQGLKKLKHICWVIKTKQAVDSDFMISKEEMLTELTSGDSQNVISENNIGNKLLKKMGWTGGGVGKDEDGIAEPVSLEAVVNREGLGLGSARGITDDYKRRVKELMENYAASDNQADLVFNCDFRLDERIVIHEEARRLNLKSRCKGKGRQRYLCVRRKRSANMLMDHIWSCGGETARYKLIPPGEDTGDTAQRKNLMDTGATQDSSIRPSGSNTDKGLPQQGGSQNLGNTFNNGCDGVKSQWAFGPPPPSILTNRDKSIPSNTIRQSGNLQQRQFNEKANFENGSLGRFFNDASDSGVVRNPLTGNIVLGNSSRFRNPMQINGERKNFDPRNAEFKPNFPVNNRIGKSMHGHFSMPNGMHMSSPPQSNLQENSWMSNQMPEQGSLRNANPDNGMLNSFQGNGGMQNQMQSSMNNSISGYGGIPNIWQGGSSGNMLGVNAVNSAMQGNDGSDKPIQKKNGINNSAQSNNGDISTYNTNNYVNQMKGNFVGYNQSQGTNVGISSVQGTSSHPSYDNTSKKSASSVMQGNTQLNTANTQPLDQNQDNAWWTDPSGNQNWQQQWQGWEQWQQYQQQWSQDYQQQYPQWSQDNQMYPQQYDQNQSWQQAGWQNQLWHQQSYGQSSQPDDWGQAAVQWSQQQQQQQYYS